ncbi:nucleotide-diphospho-sugar transferase [Mucor mucedo]|uniref:nucleotide-diphospho-sugar transferase n=1 Tax=Mucor mucedo TaxID=29922 RepID=UPI00221E6BA4|nr:nucleotide-diphospho-sugar transferase [Mucor mucedo]KAI7888197.1 nucleotide-diphospho-sugar transferase [Mucor mucedo]
MVTSSTIHGAWAVVLTSTNNYVKGVLALKHALHDLHHSEYPLLVLYTSAVVPSVIETLKKLGCIVKEIKPITPKGKVNYKFERFVDTWTKLSVWNQSGYDRLVLLDADMLPLQNMDELMRLELPDKNWVAASHACICNPQKIDHYPVHWIPQNCAYTGETCVSPVPLNKNSSYFNSGLIVLTPDESKFSAMIDYLDSISDLNIYPFPDQDFLNEIFNKQWKPISFIYNALKTLQWAHEPMWNLEKVKNIHYILNKPWDTDVNRTLSDLEETYKPLYKLWWNSYNQISTTLSVDDVILSNSKRH